MRSVGPMVVLLFCTLLAAQPPTRQEAEAFGAELAFEVDGGNTSVLTAAFDIDAMMERGTAGLEASPSARRAFVAGFKNRVVLGDAVAAFLGEEGRFKLLRVREKAGKITALFRMTNAEHVNYLELELDRRSDGMLRAIDAFLMLGAEWMSEVLRRGFLPFVASEQRGILEPPPGNTGLFLANMPKIQEVRGLMQRGDFAGAMETYQTLPAELQQERTLLFVRHRIASELDDAELIAAVVAMERAFPEDPALQFLMIDGYFLRKQYDKALAALDITSGALGGDAYLEFLLGNVLVAQGDGGAGVRAWRKAIEIEPTLAEPYWALVDQPMAEERFGDTGRWLDEIEKNTDTVIGDLRETPEYGAFVASPEGKSWLAARTRAADGSDGPKKSKRTKTRKSADR